MSAQNETTHAPNMLRVTAEHIASPEFMAQHDGRRDPATETDPLGPIVRYNSIRFAQGLMRKNAEKSTPSQVHDPLITHDKFYKSAISSGVHPEELHSAGIYSTRNPNSAPEHATASGWLNHLRTQLPKFSLIDANGGDFNDGIYRNREIRRRVEESGNQLEDDGTSHPDYGLVSPFHLFSRHRLLHIYPSPGITPEGVPAWARRSYMRDDYSPFALMQSRDDANRLAMEATGSHSEIPHVVMYKNQRYLDDDGVHLMVDQVQSDYHQHKQDALPEEGKEISSYSPHRIGRIVKTSDPEHSEIRPWSKNKNAFDEDVLEEMPDLPFDTRDGEWENVALRMALYDAARFGALGVYLPGPNWHNGNLSMAIPHRVYVRQKVVLPREAERLVEDLKPLGATMGKRLFTGTGEYLPYMRITPEMRQHLVNNGITLWGPLGPHSSVRVVKGVDPQEQKHMRRMIIISGNRRHFNALRKAQDAQPILGKRGKPVDMSKIPPRGNIDDYPGGTGPLRSNLQRFAQRFADIAAFKGESDVPVSREKFHTVAVARGVHPDELALAGLHRGQTSLPDAMTPAEYLSMANHHIQNEQRTGYTKGRMARFTFSTRHPNSTANELNTSWAEPDGRAIQSIRHAHNDSDWFNWSEVRSGYWANHYGNNGLWHARFLTTKYPGFGKVLRLHEAQYDQAQGRNAKAASQGPPNPLADSLLHKRSPADRYRHIEPPFGRVGDEASWEGQEFLPWLISWSIHQGHKGITLPNVGWQNGSHIANPSKGQIRRYETLLPKALQAIADRWGGQIQRGRVDEMATRRKVKTPEQLAKTGANLHAQIKSLADDMDGMVDDHPVLRIARDARKKADEIADSSDQAKYRHRMPYEDYRDPLARLYPVQIGWNYDPEKRRIRQPWARYPGKDSGQKSWINDPSSLEGTLLRAHESRVDLTKANTSDPSSPESDPVRAKESREHILELLNQIARQYDSSGNYPRIHPMWHTALDPGVLEFRGEPAAGANYGDDMELLARGELPELADRETRNDPNKIAEIPAIRDWEARAAEISRRAKRLKTALSKHYDDLWPEPKQGRKVPAGGNQSIDDEDVTFYEYPQPLIDHVLKHGFAPGAGLRQFTDPERTLGPIVKSLDFDNDFNKAIVARKKKKQDSRDRRQEKVGKVLHEYKQGTLRSSSGQKVVSRDQAIAIAMSEAGMSKQK